jgi:competence protein ComEA
MPELTKEQLYIILGVIGILLLGCIIGVYKQKTIVTQPSPIASTLSDVAQKKPLNRTKTSILVHISGAVEKPGVYRMNIGDRWIDLINMAQARSGADLDNVNLSKALADGDRIVIPDKVTERANIAYNSAQDQSQVSPDKVNINTADEKALDALPGIGLTTAKKIIEYRKNNRFYSIDDLKNVKGISAKKFDALKDLITVY